VYVDDIIFGSTNESLCKILCQLYRVNSTCPWWENWISSLGCKWSKWKMGHVHDGTFLCQSKYCKELLKKFKMDKCKEAITPISTRYYLDEMGVFVDQTKYRGLIGSLFYLTTRRPDIMFSVFIWFRFQSNPKESHFKAAKRILKYFKGTINVGLWYPRGVP